MATNFKFLVASRNFWSTMATKNTKFSGHNTTRTDRKASNNGRMKMKMSVRLFVSVTLYPSVCYHQSISVIVSISLSLSVCFRQCVPAQQFVSTSNNLQVYLSQCLWEFASLSLSLSVFVGLSLSVPNAPSLSLLGL